MHPLVSKLLRGLHKDRDLPVSMRVRRVMRSAAALLNARIFLRDCDAVGARARSFGRPRIDNRGHIAIGTDFALASSYGTVELATAPGGRIDIGDSVTINYGTAISARQQIKIGDRVNIGPFCIVSDSELPLPLDGGPEDVVRPIEIGDDVWLAGRVTLLPGARIGAGAVIAAGSVVYGDVHAYAIASGIPARVLHVSKTPRPVGGHT
jgi:acetyltransferase-like isoleucine patch superfamily enzyme